MRVTEITEYITPMATHSKSKTAKEITGETRRDYVHTNGVRIRESFIPTNRPTYKEWVNRLGINELTHQLHPNARERAREITARNGVIRPQTFWDELLNGDLW